MQVTNVRVSYDRKRQPAQYESAGATVEFVAVIADDADHVAAAKQLLAEAKTLVLTELGIVKAGESASAHAVKTNGSAPPVPEPVKTSGDAVVEQIAAAATAKAEKAEKQTRKRAAKETPEQQPQADPAQTSQPSSSTGSDPAPSPSAAAASIPLETESALGRSLPASAPGASNPKPNGGASGIPLDDTAAPSPATAVAAQPSQPSATAVDASIVRKYITKKLVDKSILPPVVMGLLKTGFGGTDRVEDLQPDDLLKFYNQLRDKCGDPAVAG